MTILGGEILNLRTTQRISTALVVLGVSADLLGQSKYRDLMPKVIGEHAGNFGLSSLPVIAVGIVSSLIQERGRITNNHKLESFGKNLYPYFIAFMVGINAGVESQILNSLNLPLFKENVGDFSVGLLAIALGILAVKRFRNTHLNRS